MATSWFDRRVPAATDRPVALAGATTGTARIDSVQLLRALAATMIVLLHAHYMVHLEAERRHLGLSGLDGLPLSAGVDLFFVISGFIIVISSERLFGGRNGLEFLRRRILRIVPLFWFALGLRLLVLAVGTATGQKAFPDVATIIASFLFIPCDGMGFGADYPFPILDLGWSLNYEMLFYAIMACLIGLSRERAVYALVVILLGAAVASTVAPPAGMALRFWTHPLTLEFAAGALLALLYRRGVRLGLAARVAIGAAGVAWWMLLPLTLFEQSSAPTSYSWIRIATSGTGAALLVAAATLGGGTARGAAVRPLIRLGDSSYSLYLLHPFVLLVLTQLLKRVPLTGAMLWPAVFAIVAIAILAAHLLHIRVERPVIRRLQALTDPQKPPRRLMVDA